MHPSTPTISGQNPTGTLGGPQILGSSSSSSSRATTLAEEKFSSPHFPLLAPSEMAAQEPERNCVAEELRISRPDAYRKRRDPTGLRKSLSTPGFGHQISHKFSTTFGNPTVVHRPKLRTRSSLQSLQDRMISPGAHSSQGLSPQESTSPSSFNNSGSFSPGDRSTEKTSLDSNVASLRSSKGKDQNERHAVQRTSVVAETRICEKPLTPIAEVPVVVTPTVVTVETTANAKIFFETHFNFIFSNKVSPRSQRRHDLELQLQAASLSPQQLQRERVAWASKESEHLRRHRVLKSKFKDMCGSAGVAVAGYEVIKILGKGSFGVVRLVRERSTVHENELPPGDFSSITQSRGSLPCEKINGLKMSTIEDPKPAIDDQMTPRSQDATQKGGEVFAMKVIRKSDMLRNSQEGHLRAERDFLVASEKSRWVVPLIASFQDSRNLYLVMDYMVGGDFLGLLFRKDILNEKKARWYIAEMILCVEEAHKLRWIHRDVKPDNFLISASGHLKISDFGLAFDGHWAHDQSYFNNHRHSLMEKLGIVVHGDSIDRKEGSSIAAGMALAKALTGRKEHHEKPQFDGPNDNEGILQWRDRIGKRKLARSIVGTSQYMAPEVIRGDFYDGRCDWWSIGIILYEVREIPLMDKHISDLCITVSVWLYTIRM